VRAAPRGLILALFAAVVSGVAVWLNVQGVARVAQLGDAGTYTTAKNLVAAAVVTLGAVGIGGRWAPAGLGRPRGRAQWGALVGVSVIGGSVPFLMFFEGLARIGRDGALDAQAAHKASLLVGVAVLGPLLLRERLGLLQGVGVGLVTFGYLAIGTDVLGTDTTGLLLVAGAAVLWALESVVDRWLLSDVSVATVGVARLGAGAGWLLVLGLFTGDTAALARLGASGWGWALLTGSVLALYVALWLGALREAQAVDVTAMLALAVPVTAVLNRLSEGAPLSPWDVTAPILAGAAVVAFGTWNRAPRLEPRWVRV
jgi:drug/metabolite transporter (DMT)-like permease